MTDHIAQDRKLVRAEFEAWAHKSPANLAKDAAGGYQSATVAFAWRAVQAATQRQQERIAELEAQVEYMQSEVARTERNRDMWRNQCQHQADALTTMRPDAARYQFATAYNDEGRLNFKAIYDAWDGDGSFTDQIDAAIASGKGAA